MISHYACPICGYNKWSSIQIYEYDVKDHQSPFTPTKMFHENHLTKLRIIRRIFYSLLYAAPKPVRKRAKLLLHGECLRRRILFELWCPGQDRIILTSQKCDKCGFVAYTPRPSEEDLRLKYDFLNRSKEEKDVRRKQLTAETYLHDNDIIMVNRLVNKYVTRNKLRVLDYGGAEGRYLLPFKNQGHQCELIDFYDEQLPGIQKIGNDLSDLRDYSEYDVVLCIATLEHVANPFSIVQGFYQAMSAEGIIYAQVPNEICGTINRCIEAEPVTHINFFTPGSFRCLFERAGFEILETNPDKFGSIWILARKSHEWTNHQVNYDTVDINGYLYPRRSMVVRRILRRVMRV